MNKIFNDSCLNMAKYLQPGSVNCIVTSPPYFGLRDYGVDGQIGLEQTPQEFVDKLVSVFRECKKVLRDDGTLWLNLGDSYAHNGISGPQRDSSGGLGWGGKGKGTRGQQGYSAASGVGIKRTIAAGLKEKDLIGIPWRVAFALQADGWYLRQDIIWHKPNPMPESVKDRCTKAHEYIFLLSKSPKYYFDAKAISEESVGGNKGAAARFKRDNSSRGKTLCPNSHTPTHRPDRDDVRYDGPKRNRRDVWTVATRPCKEAHFATFPTELIRPCIKAGCPIDGVVLDPFMGAGTTALVAKQEGREYVGFELNPAYIDIATRRIIDAFGPLAVI